MNPTVEQPLTTAGQDTDWTKDPFANYPLILWGIAGLSLCIAAIHDWSLLKMSWWTIILPLSISCFGTLVSGLMLTELDRYPNVQKSVSSKIGWIGICLIFLLSSAISWDVFFKTAPGTMGGVALLIIQGALFIPVGLVRLLAWIAKVLG